uniref:Uncharacterized protein n=1 Tax=Candidatus Kentrum sp. TC TaxID=2126339 RepID=A0A450Y9N2_9GAMM|nr:MAG: hypothetical protein BECKTC1821E_GA0114239_100218 [Candidatus Kentron sp. TC]
MNMGPILMVSGNKRSGKRGSVGQDPPLISQLIISFTEETQGIIRIIGARQATTRERKDL